MLRRLFLTFVGFASTALLTTALTAQTTSPVPPAGFAVLFNGQDLTGWKGLAGNPKERAKMSADELAKAQEAADERMNAHWQVVDGVLEYDGKGNNLCTAKDYGDFEMLVDWKIPSRGDSGVYLRGYPQVQIWDPGNKAKWDRGAQKGSGGLWNNKQNGKDPLVKADKPIGEWNTFYIKMIADHVTVKLNDQLVVDDVPLENYWEPGQPIPAKGPIELQDHDNKLWYKNIYVRELSRDSQ